MLVGYVLETVAWKYGWKITAGSSVFGVYVIDGCVIIDECEVVCDLWTENTVVWDVCL